MPLVESAQTTSLAPQMIPPTVRARAIPTRLLVVMDVFGTMASALALSWLADVLLQEQSHQIVRALTSETLFLPSSLAIPTSTMSIIHPPWAPHASLGTRVLTRPVRARRKAGVSMHGAMLILPHARTKL
jgi:hypothetical protein